MSGNQACDLRRRALGLKCAVPRELEDREVVPQGLENLLLSAKIASIWRK